MDSRRRRNHGFAARLGVAGAAAGAAAGLVQLSVGSRIPDWTGAKSSPAALGMLTVALSLLAGFAALRQRDTGLSAGRRTAYAAVILGVGMLCSTTVGWLWWWLPAPLLFAAGSFTIDSGHDSLLAIRDNWARFLLVALGGCQLLMAASAGPLLMAVGGLGGAILLAVAWTSRTPRPQAVGLVLVATAPFAVLGWTTIAPVLVMMCAAVVALMMGRRVPDRHAAPPADVIPRPARP